ncbi:putative Tol-pal system protein YbgF [Candidatus Magnetomoraceae bacterium gMMP-15]
MKKFIILFVFTLCCHIGCAYNQRAISMKNIAKAGAVIELAKSFGGESAAPDEISKAENYYQMAMDNFKKRSQSDSMRIAIHENQEFQKKAVENALLAKETATGILKQLKMDKASCPTQKSDDKLNANAMMIEKLRKLKEENDLKQKKIANLNSELNSLSQLKKETKYLLSIKERGNEADMLYLTAFHQFYNEEYDESFKNFQKFLAMPKDHKLKENAVYWIGEYYYRKMQYKKALRIFKDIYPKFKVNPKRRSKSADTLLKIGLCYYKLKNYDNAVKFWRQTIDEYTGTNAAGHANRHIKNFNN